MPHSSQRDVAIGKATRPDRRRRAYRPLGRTLPQGVPSVGVQLRLVVADLREDVLRPLGAVTIYGRHLIRLAVGGRHVGVPDHSGELFHQNPGHVDVVDPEYPLQRDVARRRLLDDVIAVDDVIMYEKIRWGSCGVIVRRRISDVRIVDMATAGGGQEKGDHIGGDDVAEPAAIGRISTTCVLGPGHGPLAVPGDGRVTPDKAYEQVVTEAGRLDVSQMLQRSEHVDECVVVRLEKVLGVAAVFRYPVERCQSLQRQVPADGHKACNVEIRLPTGLQ